MIICMTIMPPLETPEITASQMAYIVVIKFDFSISDKFFQGRPWWPVPSSLLMPVTLFSLLLLAIVPLNSLPLVVFNKSFK